MKKEEKQSKLKNILEKKYNGGKNQVISDLIDKAVFIDKQIKRLESLIENAEPITTIKNYSQEFIKPNPLCKEHRDYINSYQKIINQLEKINSKSNPQVEKDELEEFLGI